MQAARASGRAALVDQQRSGLGMGGGLKAWQQSAVRHP